jgi:hypothetical protein
MEAYMLSRRGFGSALAMVGTSLFVPRTASADALAPTAATTPQQALTATEQLMYSTVRLTYEETTKINDQVVIRTKWGTGFLFAFFKTETTSYPAIVTNRHVVEGMKECHFSFAAMASDGTPDLNNHFPIKIGEFDTAWIPHPSADLAIIPVGKILSELNTKLFVIALDQSLILADDELKALTPVEQVLTVGYPGALWDDVHNLPIFHRGYTATAPYIEFKGQKEFLIDFTTWPGASGSPVLLYNDGTWFDRRGNTVVGGTRAKLLGVVYGVAQQDVEGNVVIQAGPTSIAAAGRMSVPTNLGACIAASRILEFEPILVSKGLTPPANYKMRQN